MADGLKIAILYDTWDDGAVKVFTGPCQPLVFKWDHMKPGGPGPK